MDKEILSKLISKEQLYRIYEAVNDDDYKPYDRITRRKMLDSIEVRFQDAKVMKSFITDSEFKLLKEVYKKKSIPQSFKTTELVNRLILVRDENNPQNVKIADELIDVLKPYLNSKIIREGYDRYDEIIIGLVNYFGIISYGDLFEYLRVYVDDFDEEVMYEHISTSSIINYLFLCPEDFVLCRYDLYEYYDEILENREHYQQSLVFPEKQQLIQFGAYGMCIDHKDVKKMLKIINDRKPNSQEILLYWLMNSAHLGKDFEDVYLIFKVRDFSNEEIKTIEKAYLTLPSASNYGCPLGFKLNPSEQINQNFINQVQENAHLTQKDADLFYKLYLSLLEYINDKYHICPDIKQIVGIPIDPEDVAKIRKKLIEKPNIVDNFIHHRNCKLNDEEKEMVKQFRYCKFAHFVVCKHEKDYSLFMDGEDFYAVIGARSNPSEMLSTVELPSFVDTLLLPFKGKILVDGVIQLYPINFGNGFKKIVSDNLKGAKIHYQLAKYN